MRAIVYTTTGGPDVLRLVDKPRRDPGPGEVRVRIHRSGVNPSDWKSRAGSGAGTPVDPAHVVEGSPTTGETVLSDLNGTEIGVWEMTAGAMSDTEIDEVSVVIAGSATVEFVDGGERLEVSVGDVIHFAEGDRTIWHVADRVRKVYAIPVG